MYSIMQRLGASHGDLWAIEKRRFVQACELLGDMEWGLMATEMEAAVAAQQTRLRRRADRVAVIPVTGVIEHRPSVFSLFGMGTSTQLVGEALDEAIADEAVRAVILDYNTPGGTVDGVPELATKIFNARGTKPIVAIANTMMASAGLWIGTAADTVYATPSGDVGSLGVWSLHMDISGALEQEGTVATLVSAGEYKVEGNMFEPLGDDARAEMQRRVDEVYDMFLVAVAAARGVTKTVAAKTFGQGRTMSARDAKTAGLVDRIGTLEDVLYKFGQTSKSVRRRSEAGDAEKRLWQTRIDKR